MNITQVDVLTLSRWAAHQSRHIGSILTTADPREVLEGNVGNIDSRGVLRTGFGVDVKVALVEDDGPVDVVDVEVDVSDVVDVAVPDVFAGPGFKAGAVLASKVSDGVRRAGKREQRLPEHST